MQLYVKTNQYEKKNDDIINTITVQVCHFDEVKFLFFFINNKIWIIIYAHYKRVNEITSSSLINVSNTKVYMIKRITPKNFAPNLEKKNLRSDMDPANEDSVRNVTPNVPMTTISSWVWARFSQSCTEASTHPSEYHNEILGTSNSLLISK